MSKNKIAAFEPWAHRRFEGGQENASSLSTIGAFARTRRVRRLGRFSVIAEGATRNSGQLISWSKVRVLCAHHATR